MRPRDTERPFVRLGLIGALALAAMVTVGRHNAFAQAAPAAPVPPPVWTGSFGAGLALTNGNADTTNFNFAAKVAHDPMNPHVMTADAFYLHGTNQGDTIVSRSTFNVRDDYSLTDRTAVYGQFQYLRDTFKSIDYLTGPTVGVAYKLVNLEPTKFTIDAGGGIIWERNTSLGTTTSGAVTLGENFTHRFSGTTNISHFAKGLWKTSDVGDALYSVGVGLASAITPKTQLKVELLELYKSLPAPGREKGDVSFLTSVVYSF
jgi:putative salt-induced outer membrane protein YdiY